MKLNATTIVLAALMCTASAAGFVVRPTTTAAQLGKAISLDKDVPKSFGDWVELPEQGVQVVNPQTEILLKTLYSQLLSRTYVNKDGYRIMLSLAYGDDQRGGLQAHKPEICYPAQGFKVGSVAGGTLATSFGPIDVTHVTTRMGNRNEPVTYWLTVGDQVIKSGFDKRLAEMRLALTGQIPDGLLFRISSIDSDDARAFAMQQKFTADLLASVNPTTRKQLAGIATPAVTTAPS
jgi:EpsI family protein